MVRVVPTKFHPNWLKIVKICFWGGWGRLNIPPDLLHTNLLLLNINLTSPPSSIQIGPELPKLVMGWFREGWGEINVTLVTLHANIL